MFAGDAECSGRSGKSIAARHLRSSSSIEAVAAVVSKTTVRAWALAPTRRDVCVVRQPELELNRSTPTARRSWSRTVLSCYGFGRPRDACHFSHWAILSCSSEALRCPRAAHASIQGASADQRTAPAQCRTAMV